MNTGVGTKVLIVDDEEDIRTLMRLVIEGSGLRLVVCGEAEDGAQALEKVQALDPKVVVLDQRMPGLTGLETAKRILEERPWQEIILCTAYLDSDLQKNADEIGIKICLAKGEIKRIPTAIAELQA